MIVTLSIWDEIAQISALNPAAARCTPLTTSATDPGQRDQNDESDISQQGESEPQAQQVSEGQNDQADSVTLESIDSMRRSVAIQYFGVIPVAISTHGAIGQGLSDLLKEFRRRDVTATLLQQQVKWIHFLETLPAKIARFLKNPSSKPHSGDLLALAQHWRKDMVTVSPILHFFSSYKQIIRNSISIQMSSSTDAVIQTVEP
ncbi:hypothetical protein ADUPG1_012705, partial [Aduncisulcus paluster]